MKNTLFALLGLILLTTPLAATAQQSGDFTYTVDQGTFLWTVTITGYYGPGGPVAIPDIIFDDVLLLSLPVTSIGTAAFQGNSGLTSVTIPHSVQSIGVDAFALCTNLTSVAILGNVGIEETSFMDCTSLTKVTILGSVTFIGRAAFANCANLTGVFFKDNAFSVDLSVFNGDNNAIVYYLPGTTGWGTTFAGRPAVLWNPLMQTSGAGSGGFGFNITGTADIPIVIEAATSLANSTWVPLQSLNLTNGAFYFSDPNWTNYPARFYRIRSP